MVTGAAVEGRLTTSDGMELDIRVVIQDPEGEADSVATELMDLIQAFIEGYDPNPGGGERLEEGLREPSSNVLEFTPKVA